MDAGSKHAALWNVLVVGCGEKTKHDGMNRHTRLCAQAGWGVHVLGHDGSSPSVASASNDSRTRSQSSHQQRWCAASPVGTRHSTWVPSSTTDSVAPGCLLPLAWVSCVLAMITRVVNNALRRTDSVQTTYGQSLAKAQGSTLSRSTNKMMCDQTTLAELWLARWSLVSE
jgi:hypothetical protein